MKIKILNNRIIIIMKKIKISSNQNCKIKKINIAKVNNKNIKMIKSLKIQISKRQKK